MIDIHYAVQIDLSDDTSDTDATIGLYSGYLRWVTERPDYDGSTVVPTGDNDGNTWKEGFLTDRNDLGSPVRLINILASGNYGTLSGFTFTVDNTSVDGTGTGDKFSDVIFDNDYFIINRKINFYVVIDDVFYYAWGGIVTRTGYDDTKYEIVCEDIFKTVHKPLPPETISKRNFKNLLSKTEGKSIPVCFGLVDNAQILNISVKNESIDIITSDATTYRSAPISDYDSGTKTVTVLTGQLTFAANDLQGKYLRHTLDGDDQVTLIKSNTATSLSASPYSDYEIDFVIENELSTEPVTFPSASDVKGSWIEVFDLQSTYIVSNQAINEVFRGDGGKPIKLKYWDKDSFDWLDVSEIAQESDLSDISDGYPGIKVLSKVVDYEGNYNKLVSFAPKKVQYRKTTYSTSTALVFTETANGFNTEGDEDVRDYNISSKVTNTWTVNNPTAGLLDGLITFYFYIKPPDNLKHRDFENAYILVDMDITPDQTLNTISNGFAKLQKWPTSTLLTDKDEITPAAQWTITQTTPATADEIRTIPGSHYNNDEGNQEQFINEQSGLSIVSFYDKAKIFRAFPNLTTIIQARFRDFPVTTLTTLDFDFFQFAFAIDVQINIISEDVFTKVNGESTGSDTTDNVYHIIKHILEDYDGISSSDITYNNLLASRFTWKAGRQIIDRKNSKEYLTELARQSFVGIYPTREGYRGLKAFRDDDDFSSVTHDDSIIIAGSITRWEDSDINQVYNDFEIKYDYNTAGDRFEQTIFIHKADGTFPNQLVCTGTDTNRTFQTGTVSEKADGTFFITLTFSSDPTWAEVGASASISDTIGIIEFGTISRKTSSEIDIEFTNNGNWSNGDTTTTTTVIDHSTSLQAWKEYVGGYTDYNTASDLWTACNNSYTRTGRLNPLPSSLSECKWYIEESKFYDNSPGDNSAAHQYLGLLVEWSTRQKTIVEYEIPLTATNIVLELLTPIIFNDPKYTDGDDRQGYITKIKINPNRSTMSIEATLEPADIDSVTNCIIQESGQSPDDIQETGSQSDDIQEGVC